MSSLTFKSKQPSLQIDQNEVNKFYQERQQMKKKIFTPFSTQKDHNDTHPAFKNLFRRKSLANKIKQESSILDSFNNSSNEIQKVTTNKFVSSQASLSKFHHSFQSVDAQKQSKEINFPKKYNYFKAHDDESQVEDHQKIGMQFSKKQIKKRCNSVQLQNNSYSLRNHSRKSLQNIKPLKQTVPLSSILRKYQQEVNKIQKQGIDIKNDKEQSRKNKKFSMFCSDEKNKQNEIHFQPGSLSILQRYPEYQQNINYTNSHQNLQISEEIKLPPVVEECIDKWKKLQIQQLKAEQELKVQKQNSLIKLKQNKIQNIQNIYRASNTNYNQFPQKINEIQRLKLQYEQKLRLQQEKIQSLEKRNSHYKKFATSILKMKNTLQKVEKSYLNFDKNGPNQQNQLSFQKYKSKSNQVQQENDINLKQLWRWIKSLPNNKLSIKKLQCSVR